MPKVLPRSISNYTIDLWDSTLPGYNIFVRKYAILTTYGQKIEEILEIYREIEGISGKYDQKREKSKRSGQIWDAIHGETISAEL